MKRKKAVVTIILTIACLAIISVSAFYAYNRITRYEKARNFESFLDEIDLFLQQGTYQHVEAYLSDSVYGAETVLDWLKILKRARMYGKLTQNYKQAVDLTEAALSLYSGNKTLVELYVYFLAKNEEYVKAWELGRKHLGEADLFSVTAAVYGSIQLPPQNRAETLVIDILHSRDAQRFEYIALRENSESILLNTALLYLSEGLYNRANSIVQRLEDQQELAFYISYYAEDYESAYRLADRLDNNNLLIADMYLMNKDYDKATTFYEAHIAQHPDESWIPYYNLAYLYEQKQSGTAAAFLYGALEQFPLNRNLLLAFVKQQLTDNRKMEALELLNHYIKQNPSDIELSLAAIQIDPQYTNKNRQLVKLWSLFNQNPGNESLAQYFAHFLIGLHEFRDLQRCLDLFVQHAEPTYWTEIYYAVLALQSAQTERAVQHLEQSLRYKSNWYSYFNRALIYREKSNYRQALINFQNAETLLPSSLQFNALHAELKAELAETFYQDRQFSLASSQALAALELDRSNIQAQLILKKLERLEK